MADVYAHELTDYDGKPLNVVHRDVSPHNLFVTYDGEVKVVDFGIAKAALNTHETASGVLKGKVAYMAPEQAMGVPIDRRADVFAVGIVRNVSATAASRRGSRRPDASASTTTPATCADVTQTLPTRARVAACLFYRPIADERRNDDMRSFRDGLPANDNLQAHIDAVRPEDARSVRDGFAAKLAALRPLIRGGKRRALRELADNVSCLFRILVDPTFAVPWRTTAGILFALAYFISTLDVIPDAIPVLGFFDDALVVAEVVYLFSDDIARYRRRASPRADAMAA